MGKFSLPSEYEEELMQLRGELSGRHWKVAEIAAVLMEHYGNPKDPLFPRAEIRARVGDVVGMSPQMVYLHERIAKVYPPNIRAAVDPGEVATFEHWRSVLPVGIRGPDYIHKAIDTASDYGGKIAPVSIVEQWVARHQGKPVRDNWQRALDLLGHVASDEHEKPERRKLARKWIQEAK